MSCYVIDGKKQAETINFGTKELAENLTSHIGRSPSLCLIQIGEDEASGKYIEKKKKLGESLGIKVRSHTVSSSTSEKDAKKEIQTFSEDSDIDAILLQLPFPSQFRESELLDVIPPHKDVDAISSFSLGALVRTRLEVLEKSEDGLYKALLPCTPVGVLYLIHDACRKLKGTTSLEGMNALVIGRSVLVGKPVSLLLQASDATVSVAHSKTSAKDLKKLSSDADIIVSACGVPSLLTPSMIKEGSILIDVGLTYIEGKGLKGDMDFEGCSKKAAAITPVPGGVGPMTLAMLMRNVMICAEKNIKKGKQE